MLRPAYILTILLCFICSACSDSKQEIKEKFLSSSDYEKSQIYAYKARKLGLDGIPIFLEVISANIDEQHRLENYGRLMLSINYLNEMAKEGIYSKESLPVLLNMLEHQRSIADSLITAATIKIITGVDVGYDLNFVKSYTPSDEPKRKQMILKWKVLLKKK